MEDVMLIQFVQIQLVVMNAHAKKDIQEMELFVIQHPQFQMKRVKIIKQLELELVLELVSWLCFFLSYWFFSFWEKMYIFFLTIISGKKIKNEIWKMNRNKRKLKLGGGNILKKLDLTAFQIFKVKSSFLFFLFFLFSFLLLNSIYK